MSLATIVENFTLDRDREKPGRPRPGQALQLPDALDEAVAARKKNRRRVCRISSRPLSPIRRYRTTRDYVRRVIVALGERLKVYSDILDARDFFVPDDQLEYDEAAFKKRLLVDGAAERLKRVS